MKQRRSGRVIVVLLGLVLGLVCLLAAGCGTASPARETSASHSSTTGQVPPSNRGSGSTVGTSLSSADAPSSTTSAAPVASALPLRKPVEVLSRTSNPWIFQPQFFGDKIAYLEVSGMNSPDPSALPTDAAIATVDIATRQVAKVEAAKLQVPAFTNGIFWPAWNLDTLPGSAGAGSEPLLVWTTADAQHTGNGIPRWDGLDGLSSTGEARQILPADTLLLPPFRTGDFLVLPESSSAYENASSGNVGTTLGQRLLLLTDAAHDPAEVDPAAPVLPASLLGNRSPYVSWYGFYHQTEDERLDLPGGPPKVFDLRTGKLVTINVESPRAPIQYQDVEVAGTWVAWTVLEGDKSAPTWSLYLADLETGKAQRVASANASTGAPQIALSNDWLLWIDSSSKDLVGFHLPDMEPLRVKAAIKDERGASVQVAGDLALLDVALDAGEVVTSIQISPSALVVVRLK